jgi:hypothetical protein
MQTKITKIIECKHLVDDKGRVSVARVNRDTGELYVNTTMFAKIPPIRRKFILYHEAGHATLNTSDEKLADEFALNLMIKEGCSLTEILKSLTDVLSYNKPSHYDRTSEVFNKLREYDLNNNKNLKVLEPLKTEIMTTPQTNTLADIYNEGLMGPAFDDFLGLGKKSQQRREEKTQAKIANKTKLADAKAEAIKAGTFKSAGASIAESASGLVGNFFGVGKKTTDTESPSGSGKEKDADPPDDKKKDNTTIIIVVVVVVIIIVAIFMFRKKK